MQILSKKLWAAGGYSKLNIIWDNWGDLGGYDFADGITNLNAALLRTNYQLASTMLHEFYHAFQDVYGIYNGLKMAGYKGVELTARLELEAHFFCL